ncbi:MAG: UDP-N-acetylmuramoyl-tripeptide--D-alanyl-D-alanine ligase [Tissierellia bacterium]|nr:UDP-N-acetylmuramoyl-tripeptide--D-alanyl-D-alanine ligase [Tissierellia bacterium]
MERIGGDDLHKVIVALSLLFWIYLITHRSKFFLHMIQLEGYRDRQYRGWLKSSNQAYTSILNKALISISVMTLIYIGVSIAIDRGDWIGRYIWYLYAILWAFCMVLTLKHEGEAKKPLVFTNRAKRLFTTNLVLNIIVMGIIVAIYLNMASDRITYFPIVLLIGTLLYYFQSEGMYISNLIIKPVEDRINMNFFEGAKEKIAGMTDLNVIGITGSFGKTSTKFITGTILGRRYRVLNTPESYNTPMGLSMVINDSLTEEHEIFIAEMGARNIGDIRKLSELTKPRIGIITSIGPTHLETFKNIDNITKAKYELIEELPADGVAIFNYDNEYIRKMADKTFKEKILYGIDRVEDVDIYAKDIEVSERGSTFTIMSKDGKGIRCTTRLLGKHNIYNILAGVCGAIAMGMELEGIRERIDKIEPIPHRLNIMDPGTGIIVIDDTFNSNPMGTRAALDVLSQFKGGRKIVVTPGMVELGDMEEEANREFGINMGKVCDYIILIGEKRTIPIYEGVMESGYNKDNVFVVTDLDRATLVIQKIARPGDVILFENDLPDNYDE